jgi:hypothetical protein
MTKTTTKLIVLLAACMLALSCASAGASKKKSKKLGPPPTGDVSADATGDEHFPEVKKAAAESLECPEEQIVVQCTQRDREGVCIAVRAFGCEKQYEYQFGTE